MRWIFVPSFTQITLLHTEILRHKKQVSMYGRTNKRRDRHPENMMLFAHYCWWRHKNKKNKKLKQPKAITKTNEQKSTSQEISPVQERSVASLCIFSLELSSKRAIVSSKTMLLNRMKSDGLIATFSSAVIRQFHEVIQQCLHIITMMVLCQ